MFIQLKSDSKKYFAKTPFITIMEFSDTATIRDVKKKVEELIKIPANEYVIKDSMKTYKDKEKLSDICKFENLGSCCMMLYVGHNEFVGPLLLLTGGAGAGRQNQIGETIKQRPFPIWHVPTSFGDSVVENISNDSYSSSCSTTECLDENSNIDTGEINQISLNSNGNAGEIEQRPSNSNGDAERISNSNAAARSSDPNKKTNTKENAERPSNSNGDAERLSNSNGNAAERSSHSNVNATERPSNSDGNSERSSNSNGKKRNLKQDEKTIPVKRRIFTNNSELVSKNTEQLPNNTENVISSLTTLATSTLNIAATTQNNVKDAPDENRRNYSQPIFDYASMPCSLISPEIRKFIAIVKTANCEEFLETCLLTFLQSISVSQLYFDDKRPIVPDNNGDLWIACKDDYTLGWVLKNFNSIEKLEKHFDYKAYSVVMPKFQSRTGNLSDKFRLLESQNTQLNTSKWIVERQHQIGKNQFSDEKISCLSSFEILYLQIDLESEEYLKTKNFQLKFCFWKVIFEKEN